jgi:hypothetical protein
VDLFREHWRKLIAIPEAKWQGTTETQGTAATPSISIHTASATPQNLTFEPVYGDWTNSNTSFDPYNLPGQDYTTPNSTLAMNPQSAVPLGQTPNPAYSAVPDLPSDWAADWSLGTGIMPWLYPDVNTDMDINMEVNADVNWYNWVESAKGMEWDSGTAGDKSS